MQGLFVTFTDRETRASTRDEEIERLAMVVLGGKLGADCPKVTCLLDDSTCTTEDLASLHRTVHVLGTLIRDGHETSLTPSNTTHDFLGHRVFSASAS